MLRSQAVPQVLKFGIAGVAGFSVDNAILYILLYFGLGPLSARAISIPIAMLTTWTINRNWSFERSDRPWYIELAKYTGVAGVAALVNYAVFALVLYLRPDTIPLLATAIASLVAMFVSFFGYGRVVFTRNI
jgi:putative flippase GtrA